MQIDRPITIALTLFIIMLLVFFLVVPEYRTFKSLQQDLGQKTAEFNAEYDYYNAIDATYFELQNHLEDVKKIDDALPVDSNLGRLVYALQKSGNENGIIINNIFLSKSASTGVGQGVKDLGLSVSLLGSYASLGDFIRSLEKSSKIFEISSISFGAGSGGGSLGSQSQFQIQQIYSFNLEIKTYSY